MLFSCCCYCFGGYLTLGELFIYEFVCLELILYREAIQQFAYSVGDVCRDFPRRCDLHPMCLLKCTLYIRRHMKKDVVQVVWRLWQRDIRVSEI